MEENNLNNTQKEQNNSAEELAKNNKVLQEEEKENTENDKKEKSEKKGFFKNKKDEKIKELEEQNSELKTEVLRARADFENYRKRMQKELEQARERSITSFVLDILPSIDNFEMSLKMTNNTDMFIKGVEMIHGNLMNVLHENHYEQFAPEIGEEFNPHMHEPVLIENKEAEPGKVLAVLQKGYKRNDSIVRPARVQVAQAIEYKTEENQEDTKLEE